MGESDRRIVDGIPIVNLGLIEQLVILQVDGRNVPRIGVGFVAKKGVMIDHCRVDPIWIRPMRSQRHCGVGVASRIKSHSTSSVGHPSSRIRRVVDHVISIPAI